MKMLICAVTVLAVSTAQAATIHVDAANCPGPGSGSVRDPYCSIQTAIDNAVDTDEIVVAPGTYFETINFIGKAITLRSSEGAEVTIIDAQVAGTVVTCQFGEGPDTVLEGFTITGGNDPGGGGMLNLNSSPTVTNCTFIANFAELGGGMVNGNSSSPTVINCAFRENFSTSRGGGMFNANSDPTVTNCTFIGNTAGAGAGGGMYNNLSSATVINCIFDGNSAGSSGGGMANTNSSSATVTNCTFIGNTAIGGGGMSTVGSSATVTNCTFIGNTANGGGGMSNVGSSATVTNCTFIANLAGFGGGMNNFGSLSVIVVTNCTFDGNIAFAGGGMRNPGGSPTVTNCTFIRNSADFFGGGMHNLASGTPSNPVLSNCILWGNSPDQIFDDDVSAANVQYSDVEGGWPGTGNIDADPLFVDPDNGDYRLSPGSPCIDTGDNTAVPVGVLRDLDGNPRFVADACAGDSGATVDMGAYEFQGTSCDLGTMLEMLAAWGSCSDCGTCPADFDGDCSVGILDLLILLGNWTV